MAVQIEVADGYSHSRFFSAVITQRHTALDSLFFECPVLLIDEQEAWCRVAGNIDVRPAVLVEVGRRDGHAVAGPRLRNARLDADVGKGPIPVVFVKGMPPKRQALGAAVDRDAFPIAVHTGSWFGNVLKVELQVIGDEQIHVTIPVVIEEGASRTPSDLGIHQAGFFGDIFERAVSQVAVKLVLAKVGTKQILVAIVVVVTDAYGVSPANRLKPRLLGHISECPIPIVLI